MKSIYLYVQFYSMYESTYMYDCMWDCEQKKYPRWDSNPQPTG